MERIVFDQNQMKQFGMECAEMIHEPSVIFLNGDIGSGKTTWTQGFIAACGCDEPVVSPTFGLVHPYNTQRGLIHHLDLYRIENVRELLQMGVRDYLINALISIIEWPDLLVEIGIAPTHRFGFKVGNQGVHVRQIVG